MGIIVIKSLQLIEFRNSDRKDKLLACGLLINTIWHVWEECESFLNFWSSILAMSRNTFYLVKVCHIYLCLQLSGSENGALLRKGRGQMDGRSWEDESRWLIRHTVVRQGWGRMIRPLHSRLWEWPVLSKNAKLCLMPWEGENGRLPCREVYQQHVPKPVQEFHMAIHFTAMSGVSLPSVNAKTPVILGQSSLKVSEMLNAS